MAFACEAGLFGTQPRRWAKVGVIKDAGDDPDVTHGALVQARVWQAPAGSGVQFLAGPGVGTVTRRGLPVAVGQPAINPAPRRMIGAEVTALACAHGVAPDVMVEIGIEDGVRLAQKTWNPRLGIVGGLSVLGTTGIVIPFSCSAWIHAIHSGIDVARAAGLVHVAGCTGKNSEQAVQKHHRLPSIAMLDMGDFVGGMLKYLRHHPIDRLTIGGGFAKLSKLAAGAMDLHSMRSSVNYDWLATEALSLGASPAAVKHMRDANTASEALSLVADLPLASHIAALARAQAQHRVGAGIAVDVLIVAHAGGIIGSA